MRRWKKRVDAGRWAQLGFLRDLRTYERGSFDMGKASWPVILSCRRELRAHGYLKLRLRTPWWWLPYVALFSLATGLLINFTLQRAGAHLALAVAGGILVPVALLEPIRRWVRR